jgi:hypothetical protein
VFVVITIVSGSRTDTSGEGVSVFTSPTVVHFCIALFVSAVMSVPWHTLEAIPILVAAGAIAGITVCTRSVILALRMSGYKPGVDDWCWYAVFPLLTYVALLVTSAWLRVAPVGGLYAIAAVVVLLIFLGIHNAWDVVTYIAISPDSARSGSASAAANGGEKEDARRRAAT